MNTNSKYIVESVAEVLRVKPEEIDLDTTFEELQLDSLDAVEVIMVLEEKTGFELNTEILDGCKTIRELLERYEKETSA